VWALLLLLRLLLHPAARVLANTEGARLALPGSLCLLRVLRRMQVWGFCGELPIQAMASNGSSRRPCSRSLLFLPCRWACFVKWLLG
jgi:hypothetical protein